MVIKKLTKNCNIFIPRNMYSFFLILSQKNSLEDDNYILLNNHKTFIGSVKIFDDIIFFLKKKKFKIININKNFLPQKSKDLSNIFMGKFLNFNSFKRNNYISNEALKNRYEEFSSINFNNYRNVNIYYGSNMIYFNDLCKKFKNINLFFLEHGAGNFFSMILENYFYKKDIKKFLKILIKSFILKVNGIFMDKDIFYFGICGHFFNVKKLRYNYHNYKFLKFNFKKGFEEIFCFYKKRLNKLNKFQKINKNSYVFINIPNYYNLKVYKIFLDYIFEKENLKKNIFLIKTHLGINDKKYLDILLKTIKLKKKKYYLVHESYNKIPAEIIIKYFKVKEIYSGFSSILFSSYFFNRIKKINFLSSKKLKTLKNRDELNNFSTHFIKDKFISKKLNYVDLDL